MRHFIYILLPILLLTSCRTFRKSWEFQTYKGQPVAVGRVNTDVLQHKKLGRWFEENYQAYRPDPEVITRLKSHRERIFVEIYLGTWCPDSRQHVPAFIKVLDRAGWNSSQVEIYALERKYKQNERAKSKGIIRVPTFIVYKDNKELGRIIEYPMTTLEQDLMEILNGNYKHELDR